MDPIEKAANALDGFAKGAGTEAANELADVFEQAGDRIAASLERAAQTGELSFNALAESILSDFARLAVNELITAPLEGVVSALTQSISGVGSAKSSPVTVNLSLPSNGLKSSGPNPTGAQIAGQVAQAVARVQTRN